MSRLVLTALVATFICGCSATVPETAWVRDADLPDYKVGSHRVDEAVDVYIEPRISNLRRSVTPRSEKKEFVPIPIVVGPALETALLSLTRQHFSKATPVNAPAARRRPLARATFPTRRSLSATGLATGRGYSKSLPAMR